jgi:hypothetical protein
VVAGAPQATRIMLATMVRLSNDQKVLFFISYSPRISWF